MAEERKSWESDVLSKLLWIKDQAESAMELAGGSDGSDEDLGMLQSIASDIAINAQMAAELLEMRQNSVNIDKPYQPSQDTVSSPDGASTASTHNGRG